MPRFFICLTIFSLFACGDKTEDSSNTTDDSENAAPFVPNTGSWLFNEPYWTSNTCGGEMGANEDSEPTPATIISNVDGSYTIAIQDTVDLSCTLENRTLSCVGTAEEAIPNTTSSLVQQMTVNGSFSDESTLDGELSMEMSCSGPEEECSSIQTMMETTLPCVMTGTFSAVFVQ